MGKEEERKGFAGNGGRLTVYGTIWLMIPTERRGSGAVYVMTGGRTRVLFSMRPKRLIASGSKSKVMMPFSLTTLALIWIPRYVLGALELQECSLTPITLLNGVLMVVRAGAWVKEAPQVVGQVIVGVERLRTVLNGATIAQMSLGIVKTQGKYCEVKIEDSCFDMIPVY